MFMTKMAMKHNNKLTTSIKAEPVLKVSRLPKSSGGIVVPFLCCLPLLLTGCSSDNTSDLQDYVKQVKARPAGRIAPLPEIEPYENYTYQVSKLRDPFTPFAAEQQAEAEVQNTALQPDPNRKREELEQYSLDSLSYVGTIEKDGKRWALITAPDKAVYRVRPGNHMGSNYGEILSITEDTITLKEIVPNGTGGWIERDASLNISEGSGK